MDPTPAGSDVPAEPVEPIGQPGSAEAAVTVTPFSQLGGEPVVRALVDRFYDLMDLEPGYARLRSVHGSALDGARDKLFWFLCGWLGGPDHYQQRFGHPRLRARHLPFAIGSVERDQWLACMFQAMQETEVPAALQERLQRSLFDTADWMRNRPDGPPQRS
jgi:hemoglobin